MWIVPVPLSLSAQFDASWTNDAGNEYFIFQSWNGSSVLQKLGLSANDFRHRILWRTANPAHPEVYMIATSNSKEKIVKGWVWLNENIVQSLNIEVDPESKDTAIISRLMDVLPNDEHMVLSTEVEDKIGRLFGIIDESLILHTKANLVGCKSRGFLALTSHRLIFFSQDEDYNMQISYGEIEEFKVGGNILFGPSFFAKTKRSEYLFTKISPLTAYDINNMVQEIKSSAMRAIITGHSNLGSPSKLHLRRSRTSTGSFDHLKMEPTKYYFKLPMSATLIKTYSCAEAILQTRPEQKKEERIATDSCQIHLFPQWICLRGTRYHFTLPVELISSISKSSGSLISKTNINVQFKVDTDYGTAVVKLVNVAKGQEFYSAASHQLRLPIKENAKCDEFVDIGESPESMVKPLGKIIPSSTHSPSIAGKLTDELEVAWTDYLYASLVVKDNKGALLKSLEMRRWIWRYGIPDKLRLTVWPLLAGLVTFQVTEDVKDSYVLELEKAEDTVELSVVEEIERDLRRSLPEHPFFNDKRGLDALKRVLLISSYRNGLHGYTQAMNMLAAILLIYLPEPIAVEILTRCTTEWLPDTYSRSMLGGAIDQRVFEEVLIQNFSDQAPAIVTSGDAAIITFGWFVAWFANLLSTECEVRFFDVFLLEGPVAIFWFGLAIFRLALSTIPAETNDSESIVLAVNEAFKKMRTSRDLFGTILFQAFEEYSAKFPVEAMLNSRERHSSVVLRNLSDRARAGDLKRLMKLAPLSSEELAIVYDVTVSAISTGGTSNLQSFDLPSFKIIARQLVPWIVRFGGKIVGPLYEHFSTPDGGMSIDSFVKMVYKTTKASPEEQALLYHEVMRLSGDKSDNIDKNKHLFAQSSTISCLY